ncbi:MAG: DNA polymerase IV [Candidatus Aenigmarchaeota archaeon]|nr:DNA polymerase IV [Candidatus Aenigmarchaeota archaeon]
MPIILHLDLDYFYAQCEMNRHPDMKGRPVVVCVYSGRTDDSGAVATCSYEARKLGIRSGMMIVQAKRLANEITSFLPADMDFYREISGRVMEIIENYADSFEQVSIDEAYLDVSRKCHSFEGAKLLASEIKKEIKENENLTCSIGIGWNKVTSKIAAGLQKPDGLTLIKTEELKDKIWPLDVKELFTIGPKTKEELNKLGIRTIENLANFDMNELTNVLGENRARQLHNFANGVDERPVSQSLRKQISRIATLKENTRDMEKLEKFIDYLAELLKPRLAKAKVHFKTVSIMAISTDLELHTKSETLPEQTDNIETAKNVSKKLMKEFLDERPDAVLRRMGIRVANLVRKEEKQEQGQRKLLEF